MANVIPKRIAYRAVLLNIINLINVSNEEDVLRGFKLPDKFTDPNLPSPIHENSFIGPSVNRKKLDEMFSRGVLGSDETLEAAMWGGIEFGNQLLIGRRSKHKKTDLSDKAVKLSTRSGLMILTNHRIIFYMPKMLNRYEFEAYELKQIDSIRFTKGLRKGRIDITTTNNNRVIKGINNEEGITVVDMIQRAIDKINTQRNAPTVVAAAQSPIDVLKMKFINGEITKEEYEEKRKILDGL